MEREIDEISLREIIGIIWNGKWVIAITTIVAILISGVSTLVLSTPMYEARTTVILNNLVKDNATQLSLEAYKEQVENHGVMSSAISRLDEQLKGTTITGLREKIETEIVKGTNLIRIYVTDEDQELVALIANAVTEAYINYINEQAKLQLRSVLQYELAILEDSIIVTRANQSDLQKQLVSTPQNLITKKSLSENEFLKSTVPNNENPILNTGSIQYHDEELNPLYITLQQSLSDINLEISNLENRKQIILNKINKDELGTVESLLIASPAIEPEEPNPSIMKITIVLAGLIGVVTSLILVFIRHYWRATSSSGKLSSERISSSFD